MFTDNNNIVSKRGTNEIVKQLNQILEYYQKRN